MKSDLRPRISPISRMFLSVPIRGIRGLIQYASQQLASDVLESQMSTPPNQIAGANAGFRFRWWLSLRPGVAQLER